MLTQSRWALSFVGSGRFYSFLNEIWKDRDEVSCFSFGVTKSSKRIQFFFWILMHSRLWFFHSLFRFSNEIPLLHEKSPQTREGNKSDLRLSNCELILKIYLVNDFLKGIFSLKSGSISALSKPNFASKYSFESSRGDLHNALFCTRL